MALVAATGAVSAAAAAENPTVFTFTDRAIDESSGLVDRGPLIFTTNDSGDGPVLYAVDKATGDTVATTTYSAEPVTDVEALAPGSEGAVWVGDIGDNNAERPWISVYRVVPLGGLEQQLAAADGDGAANDDDAAAERFNLVYPDGPHDAETLLAHPETGQLFVVTKDLAGGTVYAAPSTLDSGSVNRLERVGEVPGRVTDGSFLPDGEHILLRSYGRGALYTFPELELLANFDLPSQKQGEGLAVADTGEVYISTEGMYSDVVRVSVPPEVSEVLDEASTGEASTGEASPSPAPDQPSQASDIGSTGDGPGVWIAAGVVVLAIAAWLWFTVSRSRSRRSR